MGNQVSVFIYNSMGCPRRVRQQGGACKVGSVHQDLYQQQPETIWGAALREFINLELQIDNARPSNLLGRNGSWVKEYRRQMEEEGP